MGRTRARRMSAVVAGLMVAALLSPAIPSAAATNVCAQDTIPAEVLPEQVSLDDCDMLGTTITSEGLRLDVPPPGQGRSIHGLTARGEVSLEISTSRDGVVAIETNEVHGDESHEPSATAPAPYSATQTSPYPAGGDDFSAAAPLVVPNSFMPTTGQTFNVADATTQPDEPAPGCDASAAGSLWYRIQRPGTLRRIKLRADVPLAVYRGTTLGALQRVACVPAGSAEKRLTLAPTGVHYVQLAVTQADVALGRMATHVWLLNGEMRPDGAPPCDARVHQLVESIAPRKPLKWRFKAGSTPPSLTRTQALRGIKRGMAVITGAKNDCGMADTVGARQTYLGRTRKGPSLCNGRGTDGVSSVSFGPAEQYGMLGLACSAWMTSSTGKRHTIESDMRFTSTVPWTMRPDAPGCRLNVDIDLVGVAAHEAGHVFGLDHALGTKALNQTMSVSQGSCNAAFRTLGRGDVVALRKLY